MNLSSFRAFIQEFEMAEFHKEQCFPSPAGLLKSSQVFLDEQWTELLTTSAGSEKTNEARASLDVINLCAEHPLEMSAAAGVGLLAGIALMRSPSFWKGSSEISHLGRRVFAAIKNEPPTTWNFNPKLQWKKEADGTFNAVQNGHVFKGFADGTVKETLPEGWFLRNRTMYRGGTAEEWMNGVKQTDRFGKVETLFPDGRRITVQEPGFVRAEMPNGTVFEQGPQLNLRISKPNGTVMSKDANGQSYVSLPGGSSFGIDPNGARRLYMSSTDSHYVMPPGNKTWLEWTINDSGNSVHKPVFKKLPFTDTDPVQHELNKLLPKIWSM
jgi:hypothetical protein